MARCTPLIAALVVALVFAVGSGGRSVQASEAVAPDVGLSLREEGRKPTASASGARGRRCPSARRALGYYKARVRYWTELLELPTMEFRRPAKCRYARREARWRRSLAYGLRHRFELLEATPELAIRLTFGPHASEAVAVASCESGLSPRATNGQYLGLFQMGSYARARYGHGSTALEQARYAYRYFVASGRDWSPWSCKP